MKLYKIILWGVIGLTFGYVLIRTIIFKEPFVFDDLFTRLWFFVCGIVAGWYFKGKDDKR